MAVFNPPVPDPSNPDRDKGYIGYSEGFRPVPVQQAAPAKQFSNYADQSAAIRAKGKSNFQESVGKLFGSVIEGVDFVAQKYIENTITDKTNAIRDEYGVADIATLNTDGVTTKDPSLPQLETARTNLEKLSAGYASGRLPETQYWARVESMVRQMKTRFPGYRGEIDSMVSKITGATPANVLRAMIQDEAIQTAKASNEAYKNEREYKEAMSNSGAWGRLFPGKTLDEVPYEEAVVANSRLQAEEAQFKYDSAALEYNQKVKGVNAVETQEAFTRQVQTQVFPAARDQILKQLGFEGWSGFNAFIAEVAQNPTPENQERALQAFAAVKTGVEQSVYEHKNRWYAGKDGSPILTDEQANTAIASIRAQMKSFEELLTNKDWGTAGAYARAIEHMSSQKGKELMESNVFMANKFGIQQSLGKDAADEWLKNTPGATAKVEQGYAHYYTGNILNGKGTLHTFLTEAQSKGLNITSTEFNQVLDNTLKAVVNPKMSPEERARAARVVFSQENRDLIARLGDPKTSSDPVLPESVYAKMTAPEVQKAMLDLQKVDPQAFAYYNNYVRAAFSNVFKQSIDDINEVIVSSDEMDINFDEKTGELKVNVFKGGPKDSDQRSREQIVQNLVQDFNVKLEQIEPILTAKKTNGVELMRNFLDEIGYDINPEGRRLVKQGSYGRQLWQSIRNFMASDGTEGPNVEAQKRQKLR